jgi:hypothetical protein
MVEHGFELVEALDAFPSSADMPITCMDDLHGRQSITAAPLSAVFLVEASVAGFFRPLRISP